MGVMKAGGDHFVDLLYHLIYKIMKDMRVPKAMKQSTVVLLHKKGPKNDPMNYRPISLL